MFVRTILGVKNECVWLGGAPYLDPIIHKEQLSVAEIPVNRVPWLWVPLTYQSFSPPLCFHRIILYSEHEKACEFHRNVM